MINLTLNPDAPCASGTHLPGPHRLHDLGAANAHLPAPHPGHNPAPSPPSRRRLTGIELAARLLNPLAR